MPALSDIFSIRRRYSRSVNLERDMEVPDAVAGYFLTTRAIDALERFYRAYSTPKSVRAWTITGPYGTGKSAFAHFLSALSASADNQVRQNAVQALEQIDKTGGLKKLVLGSLADAGLIRAAVTAQREPIANTILRALEQGASIFWRRTRGPRPKVLWEIADLRAQALAGKTADSQAIIEAIRNLAKASRTGILLIIDELGKNLEFSSQNQSLDDLFLLQQIAELPSGEQEPKIFLFGLLHQSFVDYAHGLTTAQRNEWAKIQGRFEDIPFAESSERVLRLIGHAIERKKNNLLSASLSARAEKWNAVLKRYEFSNAIDKDAILAIYPLHPLSALVLPILCNKFSQNDRTLFTFLASAEPNSFSTFLNEAQLDSDSLPTFRLSRIYDYFVEASGVSVSLRPHLQRWTEIQGRISDAKYSDEETLSVLKTIGLLNLVSATGSLRASKELVALAMCDTPQGETNLNRWEKVVDKLIGTGFLTWRKQFDEVRIWEGSDFDIEREILLRSQELDAPLSSLLNEYFPLRPVVAQRHSYKSGTLRYFERQYFDNADLLCKTKCVSQDSDGLIAYWVGKGLDLDRVPHGTSDGKPLVIIVGTELSSLRLTCWEYTALRSIETNATQLQADGVARREVRERLLFSRRLLDEALSRSFDISSSGVSCWIQGNKEELKGWTIFQACLSDVCDEVYDQGIRIWNELINRRELTSQGASARRKLIEVMLQNAGVEKLGLKGYGPECSIFESLLRETGLYREQSGKWLFSDPPVDSGIYKVWKAIETFFLSATESPKELSSLYAQLDSPPFGVKKGVVPILLLSVLLCHEDQVSIYIDGTFIPVLGPEHFELLVKKPERFAVKFFEISGLRAQIFKEMAEIISKNLAKTDKKTRNATILSVVKPLIQFVTRMPPYAATTNRLSPEAKAVRKALFEAKEPDELLFVSLPRATGMLFDTSQPDNASIARLFKKKLVLALKELQTAYDTLLVKCYDLVYKAFGVRSERGKLREDLRVRASYLLGQIIEPRLKSFVLCAADEQADARNWLEGLLMIISGKPPRSWNDEDVALFELKLGDLARRFLNLERLQQRAPGTDNAGFDARRITITYPDGNETDKIIWIDTAEREKIDQVAQQVLDYESLKNDDKLLRAVVAVLVEKALGKKEEEETTQLPKIVKERKVV